MSKLGKYLGLNFRMLKNNLCYFFPPSLNPRKIPKYSRLISTKLRQFPRVIIVGPSVLKEEREIELFTQARDRKGRPKIQEEMSAREKKYTYIHIYIYVRVCI